jgi:anhydro-N-acetylmuramic acid kinase
MKNNFKVIGLMSGTSLDGLDIAYCEFWKRGRKWVFGIHKATLVKYPSHLSSELAAAQNYSPDDFMELDARYGKFIGKACRKFILDDGLSPDFISSHGHTILHQPKRGYTTQIGNGNAIHAETNLPVVYDFRSLDVMLGGEGAPLVPAGDRLLFSDYKICLNLGGIANLSADMDGERKAYDICFCNTPLNYIMRSLNKEFDKGGRVSSTGTVNDVLLREILKIYKPLKKKRPSLGRELFEKEMKRLLDNKRISAEDKLATCTESTAIEVAEAAKSMNGKSMLCTGGGAFNSFLLSRILHHCGDYVSIIVPEEDVIKFKEAMVFAFLGVLRVRGEENCLKSVTGATRNSSGGALIGF